MIYILSSQYCDKEHNAHLHDEQHCKIEKVLTNLGYDLKKINKNQITE